jgi:hypothetical protein
VPSRVAETLGAALDDRERVPAVTVAVAVTLLASADDAAARLSAVAATAAQRNFIRRVLTGSLAFVGGTTELSIVGKTTSVVPRSSGAADPFE